MERQLTLAGAGDGFEKFRKPTRRDAFLANMNEVVPWALLCQEIQPHYPKEAGPKGGRPAVGVERMLRIHCLQHWFNLSDPAVEEALYDSPAMRAFVGIDLGREPVPDETTIMRFRHLLERHGLGKKLFTRINSHLKKHGLLVSNGTIVDATIITAPSSTKNKKKERDPEMRPTQKSNQWYFGMKIHVGADSRNKVVHSLVVTAANVHDSKALGELLHGEERKVWGDQGYVGQGDVIRACAPQAQNMTHCRVPKGAAGEAAQAKNHTKSKVRAKVEHVFQVVKCLFGFRKVRYRGLKKNANRAYVAFALGNLFMVRHDLRRRTALT